MNKIEAIASPGVDLESLEQELETIGITGMSVTELRVFGRDVAVKEVYRGVEHMVRHTVKLKIELLCNDNYTPVVDILRRYLRIGNRIAGKVFVIPVAGTL